MRVWSAVVVVVTVVTALGACQTSDFLLQTASVVAGAETPVLSAFNASAVYNDQTVNAWYSWSSNPVGFFHILFPEGESGQCGGYLFPSRRARQEGCLYATNAGPFSMHQPPGQPTCQGYVVSYGEIALNEATTSTNFGILSNGSYVMGELTSDDVDSMGFEELVTGFGWLLREGVIQVAAGGEIAPRTAIGSDIDGRLLIFEADGQETSYLGLTLQQLAQWGQQLGAYNLVNLDGGGSSVTVINGTIVDKPTCIDIGIKCERPVTTMTCVMPGA